MVHQQKRQVFNLSFLLVHLKGTSTRHSRNIGYRKSKKCRRSHSRKRILPRVPASGKRQSLPKVQKCREVITPVFLGSKSNVGVRIIKFHNIIFWLKVKCWGVKKNTSTFILESVVFYVLNYNFEQNLGSLLTLYVIYVIMFKKK